jgi:hypothetical protein
MLSSFRVMPRAVPALMATLGVVAGVTTVSLAAGGGTATTSAKKVKVKCPAKAKKKAVTCKIKGQLPAGPAGAPGVPGAPGLSGYEVVSATFPEVFAENSGGQRGLSELKAVSCPAGKKAIGGGADLGTNPTQNGQQRQMILSASVPSAAGDGWSVQLFNNSTSIDSSLDVRVYAICASVG